MKIKITHNPFVLLFCIVINWSLWIRYFVPISFKASDITNCLIIIMLINYIACYKKIPYPKYLWVVVGFYIMLIFSSLAANFIFGQSIFDGIVVQRNMFIQLLLYFALLGIMKGNDNKRRLIYLITIYSIRIASVLYALHYCIYEITGKLFLNFEPAQWGRYGTARFYFLLIMPSFLLFHAVANIYNKKSKLIYYFDVIVVLFLMVQVCKMRMTTLSTIFALVIGLLISKKMGLRKTTYILGGTILGVLFVTQTEMGGDFLNVAFGKDNTMTIRDYGRALHLKSFIEHPIFGLGYPHENCIDSIREFGAYNNIMLNGTSQGVYIGDNGIFDFIYIFGCTGILWLVYTFQKLIKDSIEQIKNQNNTLYFMYILFLIFAMYTEFNWYFGGMIFFSIFMALLETEDNQENIINSLEEKS